MTSNLKTSRYIQYTCSTSYNNFIIANYEVSKLAISELLLDCHALTFHFVDLGNPEMTVNCTAPADYVKQLRSIQVSWLLNSTPPSNILDNKGRARVHDCNLIIKCGNGYIDVVIIYIGG